LLSRTSTTSVRPRSADSRRHVAFQEWVKVPGTSKRQPRNRPADEVISVERPELRIIDAELSTAVRDRLTAIHVTDP